MEFLNINHPFNSWVPRTPIHGNLYIIINQQALEHGKRPFSQALNADVKLMTSRCRQAEKALRIGAGGVYLELS